MTGNEIYLAPYEQAKSEGHDAFDVADFEGSALVETDPNIIAVASIAELQIIDLRDGSVLSERWNEGHPPSGLRG